MRASVPMTTDDLLKAGRLADAIDSAVQTVKSAPGDVRARILLFEALALAGEWERAAKHLAVIADKATDMATGASSYQATLRAEEDRERTFSGEGAPARMTSEPFDPEPYLTAIRHVRQGRVSDAIALLDPAVAARPPRAGRVDGRPFADLYEADDLLAPHLEVIANGIYGWIPFAQIAKLEFEPTRFLRDLIWRPTNVTLTTGASATMFVPVRYPGSERATEDPLRLGRATDWIDHGGLVTGVGQRALAVDDDLVYLLDVGTIEFDA